MAEAGQHTQDYDKAMEELTDVDQKVHEAHALAKALTEEAKKIASDSSEDLEQVMTVKPI
jgi:hypothetical protein